MNLVRAGSNLDLGWPGILLLILGIAAFSLLAMVLNGRFDKRRIRQHLAQQGARLTGIAHCMRVEAMVLDENERFYRIAYLDRNGWQHGAICKTSCFGGIYHADDQVTGPLPGTPEFTAFSPVEPDPSEERLRLLEEENRRLKEALQRDRNGA